MLRFKETEYMNKLYRFLIPLVFFGLWISCASAANVVSLNNQAVEMNTVSSQDIETTNPINWVFFPPEPVCGDTLNIIGVASSEEKVNVSVTFNKTVPVSEDGSFEYTLENVTIPKGLDNLFTVDANGAKNLNVRVKMAVWVAKSSNASGDTATVSQSNVPAGTYKIKIDGDAGEGVSEVNLKITAFEKIKANSNGIFSYSYNTTAVPPGNFKVKVGDITREITLKPNEETPLVLPIANFSSDISAGYTPLTVKFTDMSENATSVNWDFENDGDIDSTKRNPIHKFTTAGTYTVNLTAINENGTNSTFGIIEVTKKPIPGHTKLPTDPNNDGRYEDVNGNGGLDFDDVVAYYDNMDWINENVPVTLFDYNNNGHIDFNDVVKLYKKI
jgi:FOG: PKD repeat